MKLRAVGFGDLGDFKKILIVQQKNREVTKWNIFFTCSFFFPHEVQTNHWSYSRFSRFIGG